jgi:hypothetical protein
MKALKIIIGLVIVVVIAVVVIGLQNINGLVKAAIEEVGTDVIGTQVRLQSANIEITDGRGELNQLSIANPNGFSNTSAFELGKVVLQVDPSSITSDVIVIKEVFISGANLLAEQKGLTETNLQALLNNVTGAAGSSSTDSNSTASTTESNSAVLFAVEKFTFSDSNLKVVTEKWGDFNLTLPAISLKNIGSKDKGLTPEQLTEAMIQPILKSAEKSVKQNIEKMAKNKAKEKLQEKLNDKLGSGKVEQLNQLKSLFGK